ncbi:hypothetical protein CALVIDRAFT_389059 [Calocera viscosa TUFC12733]|uniref:CUE domain-containing protein n=1 Tax=Calocera viscosa (strain TUFC12733) TaxID=1330018 RepID=A0A167GJY7_CALVF|nr:hypothetical protein CALVIDRAFT_389059 [Calocera viscosa TUFC12733]
MEDLLYIIVAVIIIYVSYRWLFSSGNGAATSSGGPARDANTAATLGFRPRNVTPEMVQTVAAMFPDIPEDNIRYDLLRTGSTERTVNSVLEKGFLPAPPPTYIRQPPATTVAPSPAARPAAATSSAPKSASLISRFHLEGRIRDSAEGANAQLSSKAPWEATPEQRQASLSERKAQMILAARKRLLEKQAKAATVPS